VTFAVQAHVSSRDYAAPPASSDTQRDQDTGRTSSCTPARIGQRKIDRRSPTTMSAPQKRVWAVTATLTLMCFFASLVQQCCAAMPSEPAPPGPPPYPFNDPTLPTDQRVADLVSRLTLEEKVTHTHSHTSFIDAAWRGSVVAMQMVLHQQRAITQVRACIVQISPSPHEGQ